MGPGVAAVEDRETETGDGDISENPSGALIEWRGVTAPFWLQASMGAAEEVDKCFFMVLFAGEVMREKISKICTYFGASLYKYPEDSLEREAMSEEWKEGAGTALGKGHGLQSKHRAAAQRARPEPHAPSAAAPTAQSRRWESRAFFGAAATPAEAASARPPSCARA